LVKDQKAPASSIYNNARAGFLVGDRTTARGTTSGTAAVVATAAVSTTAQPTSQQIRCLDCGYEYRLNGRMPKTNCPKCRAALDLAGFTIAGECHDELRTLGNIRITTGSVVTGARLVATDIILAGRVASSSVEAFRQLVVQAGAEFLRREIRAADLRIDPGAEIGLAGPVVYRHIEILGRVRANLYCTGMLIVRAGGLLVGDAHSAHIMVEDGAGIVGSLRISPEGGDEARKASDLLGDSPAGWGDEQVRVTGYEVPTTPSGC